MSLFQERLSKLGFANYQEYLKSANWKAKRAKVYATQKLTICWICRTPRNLNVHHKSYARLGDEKLQDLILLCRTCHEGVHEFQKERPYLPLKRATELVYLMMNKPLEYQRQVKKLTKKREKLRQKRLWRFDYKDIQSKENAFNRAKLERQRLLWK